MENRELKFRAWDKHKKEWLRDVDEQLFINQEMVHNGKFYIHDRSYSGYINIILMQYTGLKDKNGKEIYEGDILRISTIGKGKWDNINYVAYEVFFHGNDMADKHIGFQMNRTHFQGSIGGTSHFPDFLPKNTKKMEIIGNIHENLELIEK